MSTNTPSSATAASYLGPTAVIKEEEIKPLTQEQRNKIFNIVSEKLSEEEMLSYEEILFKGSLVQILEAFPQKEEDIHSVITPHFKINQGLAALKNLRLMQIKNLTPFKWILEKTSEEDQKIAAYSNL